AILLIVKLLNRSLLKEHLSVADSIGLDCLVEVHNANEITLAVDCGAKIIGINNRNLDDFSVTLKTSEELGQLIPEGIIKVAESGIAAPEDIKRLHAVGFNCFLVGEALMTADDPVSCLKLLRGE
ncbi:MAG: indole-3-glycerol-phosphate synthase TrpC, partial [Candidatus Zixiibacteriota bacterium]